MARSTGSEGIPLLQSSWIARLKTPLDKLRRRQSRNLIAKSGLFDAKYYRSQGHPQSSGEDPIQHYLDVGWRIALKPNRLFDTAWYLDTYPEVASSGVNPLVDFIRSGAAAGRNPSPLFDTASYLADNPDVRRAGANPLAHYLNFGRFEGRAVRWVAGTIAAPGAMLTPFESWLAVNALSARDLQELRLKLAARAGKLPRISVLTPVYQPDREFLEMAVRSVCDQVFEDWELWLVTDGDSTDVAQFVDALAATDDRIRALHLPANGGISAATNAGAAVADGAVLLFLDQDDLLTRDCLAEIAIHYCDHPEGDMVYSDDDKIDAAGRYYQPQFKPHWSGVLLLSWMYLGHVFTVRRELFQRLGGFRTEFDGAQDFDFALRAAEAARAVGHVPRILYHWRAVEGSTATSGAAKPESIERGRRAVEEATQRRGIAGASVIQSPWAAAKGAGVYDLSFPDQGPSVSIIVRGNSDLAALGQSLRSLAQTRYRPFEVLVAAGEARNVDLQALEELALANGGRVVGGSNDDIISGCDSDLLLFLDSGLVALDPSWLGQMVGWSHSKGVGVVGARLLSADGRLCHAGMVRGPREGLIAPAFAGLQRDDPGYLGLAKATRECSSVSGCCMLTPRSLFADLRGFNQARFPSAFADADYCYRVIAAGHSCIVCGSAELQSLAADEEEAADSLCEQAVFGRMYGHLADAWYNPNLSLESGQFEINAVRRETVMADPVRLVAISHNLNNEGAATTLLDLLTGLAERGYAVPVVVSPTDGPLRKRYEQAGIAVLVQDELAAEITDVASQEERFRAVGSLLSRLDAEVVLANTLRTYWAVKGASSAGVPALWAQHESDPWETYFDYLPPDGRHAAYDAFAEAYQVIYVAEATRQAWRAVETRRNFKLIRHGIPQHRLMADLARWSRPSTLRALGVPEGSHAICVVGSVCRRKGQLDIVKAFGELPPDLRSRTFLYLVGAMAEPDYVGECSQAVSAEDKSNVVITGPVEDVFLHLMASDIAVCTSRVESAPRVLLEAMACGLPIVTTPVFGIKEMVKDGLNALFYEPGDVTALAAALEKLLRDKRLRDEMGAKSRQVLDAQPGFEHMVEQYGRAVRQAVNLNVEAFRRPGSAA